MSNWGYDIDPFPWLSQFDSSRKKKGIMAPVISRKRKNSGSHGRSKGLIIYTGNGKTSAEMGTQTDAQPNIMNNVGTRSTYKMRGRSSKYRKSSRASTRSKRKSKRSSRGGRGGNSLAGGKALIGSPDEEDAQVKSHMRRGIVVETGVSGVPASTGQGNHAGYIVHSTFPQATVVDAFMLAILKAMYTYSGQSFKNPDEVVAPFGGGGGTVNQTVLRWQIIYYVGTGSNVLSANATVGTTTFYSWATGMATQFWGITADAAHGLTKFGISKIIDASPTVGNNTLVSIDLDVCKVKMDLVSNLVYQNQTGSSALDVSQDPMFEVHSIGKGTGPIGVDGSPGYPLTKNFFVNWVSGVAQSDAGTNKYLIAEPSRAYFTNTKKVVNTSMNPGVMKQSKLKSHYEFTLTKLFPYLTNFGTLNYPNSKLVLGKFKHIWYRKTIDLAASAIYTVCYQHHFAIGATCKVRHDFRTAPYVARIQ